MCGIAGLIQGIRVGSVVAGGARNRLAAMLRAIKHRGPDDWGMAIFGFQPEKLVGDDGHVRWLESPDTHLALGHQRLSILDLSPSGRQPMFSADGIDCITFNGEIYNYVELRDELARNIEFRTRTDTEVLLAAYQQWGIDMLKRLDGMFAFALWDGRAKKLLCVRDPIGIKPFYFAKQNGTFFFASEPRAVLAGLEVRGTVDARRIAEFLVLGVSDHDEGTSYQEVRQLRGGHFLEVDAAGFVSDSRRFWKPPQSALGKSLLDVPNLVREQIKISVKRQLRSDVPVGGCLSGGLDSGSIVANIGEILGSEATGFKALTLASRHFDGDESNWACTMARHAGVSWEKVEMDDEIAGAEIRNLTEAMDEPFPSLSMLGQRKIMQQAHALGLKVMLDGQGGDEVFVGYPRVAMRGLCDHFSKGNISSALREWSGLRKNASQGAADILLNNIFFASPSLVYWRNKRRVSSFFNDDFLEQARPEIARKMYGAHQNILDLQIGELTRFCLPQLLRFEDRNSMAFGVEARVPLLSVDLVELALGLPLNWKVTNGWTKYALRAAMKDRLPEGIVWSTLKRGFEVPQKRWIEAARADIVEWLDILPDNSPAKKERIVAHINAGRGGEHWFLRCLSVALWMCFSGARP